MEGIQPSVELDIKHSIIVPFTRKWCVKPFFESLEKMELENTQIIFYVDTSDRELYDEVKARAVKLNFDDIQVIFGRNGIHENDSVMDCRKRIANVHESLKPILRGSKVIGLEDDTICPPHTLKRLTGLLNSPEIGFVQGVEVGRRGYRVFGVWKTDGVNFSTSDKGQGVEEVTAGGFYCFATWAELYKKHNFDSTKLDTNLFGPDFNYGYSLTKQGFKCLTDWDLECIHLTEDGEITVNDFHHIATWIRDGDKWRKELVVKNI